MENLFAKAKNFLNTLGRKTSQTTHNLDKKEKAMLILSSLFFLALTLYVSYPDEFVNLLGARTIVQGKIPYKDFFDHHMPGAWYLGAVIMLISGKSFVLFRILWAVLQILFLFLIGRIIRKDNPELYKYYLFFLITYPLISVYFWTHLFLADSIATLIAAGILWILLNESLKKTPEIKNIKILIGLNFALIFTSLTFVYFALAVYLWTGILFFKIPSWRKYFKKTAIFLISPFLIYALYLFITDSYKEFWFYNFTYNTQLYIDIPNYTRGRFFNPIKMAFTLLFNFYDRFLPALRRFGGLDFHFPVIQTSSFAVFTLFLLLLTKHKKYAFLFLLLIGFSAPRSSITELKVADYQSGVFIASALVSFFYAIYLIKKSKVKDYLEKTIYAAGYLILFSYGIFTFAFAAKDAYEKLFFIYTQKMPRIYDFDYAAAFIDEILQPDEYFWIGPYEPNRVFFVKKARLPGKFPTLLPQFRENERIKSEFLQQFEKNPPKIIIFKHEASIFMTPAPEFGKFFLEYLASGYTRISEIQGVKVLKSPSEFNLKDDLYIYKKDQAEILQRLENKGYIQQDS